MVRMSTNESKKKTFKEKLDKEGLEFFSKVAERPYSGQAVAFLDAYWAEVSTQAEFIFTMSLETMIDVDMAGKGCEYRHKYKEGKVLDFDLSLRMYELLCKRLDKNANESKGYVNFHDKKKYGMSHPKMMTSIKRKKALKAEVDVNFDGKMSMLEFLLYQYKDFADPADFVTRYMAIGDEPPEVRKARLALAEVMAAIRKYEAKKSKLLADSKKKGIRGLTAKNELAQLDASPIAQELQKLLITAEAKVRIATRKYGGKSSIATDSDSAKKKTDVGMGGVWWVKRDLKEKKKKYGKKKK